MKLALRKKGLNIEVTDSPNSNRKLRLQTSIISNLLFIIICIRKQSIVHICEN